MIPRLCHAPNGRFFDRALQLTLSPRLLFPGLSESMFGSANSLNGSVGGLKAGFCLGEVFVDHIPSCPLPTLFGVLRGQGWPVTRPSSYIYIGRSGRTVRLDSNSSVFIGIRMTAGKA